MPIVFESKRNFSNMHPEHQRIIEEYLLGKRFDSLEEAFSQEYMDGHSLAELFRVGSRIITPKDLPATVNDVEIWLRQYEDYGKILIELSGFPVLRAKYVSEN